MNVRKLTREEYFDSDRISRICFHDRSCHDEAQERANPGPEREDWGAFGPGGRLTGHIINNHYEMNLNGCTVAMGGVGAVSTLPEYRSGGTIRQIFEQMLPERRCEGEVISCLYPFKHAFYRKFGYETVQSRLIYELKPPVLRHCRFDGEARQYALGEATDAYLEIYERFSRQYNLTLKRSAEGMRRWLLDNPLPERKFAYILEKNGEKLAYVCFTDQYCEQAAKLIVTDLAWAEPAGFNAILGFLGRFEADYGSIELSLPTDRNLQLMLPDPYEIDASKLTGHYMLRVVNVPEALKTLCAGLNSSFRVAVYWDVIIPENNHAWRVCPSGVEPFTGTPDVEMSLHAFNQLICGAIDLEGALYRPDVSLKSNAAVLKEVFRIRSAFIMDRF